MLKKLTRKQVWYSIAGLAIVILLSLVLAYGINSSDPITKALQNIYPAALVGFGNISINSWKENAALTKKINPDVSDELAYDQLIKRKKEEKLAVSLNLKSENSAFDNELKFYVTGKNLEYDNFLKNYFSNNESLFKEYVVKSQVNLALLKIKYNSDFKVNTESYARAINILISLKNGTPFEQLAKSESDDLITGQMGGDLGFVSAGQLLPELEKAVINAPLGQAGDNIVVSRLGYHIIYPVETAERGGQKIWHVKHILVITTGFDNWLNPQLNRIWVWRLK